MVAVSLKKKKNKQHTKGGSAYERMTQNNANHSYDPPTNDDRMTTRSY